MQPLQDDSWRLVPTSHLIVSCRKSASYSPDADFLAHGRNSDSIFYLYLALLDSEYPLYHNLEVKGDFKRDAITTFEEQYKVFLGRRDVLADGSMFADDPTWKAFSIKDRIRLYYELIHHPLPGAHYPATSWVDCIHQQVWNSLNDARLAFASKGKSFKPSQVAVARGAVSAPVPVSPPAPATTPLEREAVPQMNYQHPDYVSLYKVEAGGYYQNKTVLQVQVKANFVEKSNPMDGYGVKIMIKKPDGTASFTLVPYEAFMDLIKDLPDFVSLTEARVKGEPVMAPVKRRAVSPIPEESDASDAFGTSTHKRR